ncbi:MAG: hypothetical protein NZO16_04910, partial [Deltaproteobacteria bacterium]|nr:hypothetical protein [Deltaproteobacteria bacterium]
RENNTADLFKLKNDIINLGYSCEVYSNSLVDVKKQLKYAEKKGFDFAIFARSTEISLVDRKKNVELKFNGLNDLLAHLEEKNKLTESLNVLNSNLLKY